MAAPSLATLILSLLLALSIFLSFSLSSLSFFLPLPYFFLSRSSSPEFLHTFTWPTTGKCNLCTTEKAFVAYTHPSLNKRRELFSICPHRRKHLLSNLKMKSEEKKSFKRQCTKPQCTMRQCTKTSWRGRTKMSGRNRLVEAKQCK